MKQTFALLLLRAVPGAIFLAHGISKLFLKQAETIEHFARLGFPSANFLATGVGVLELTGGILLIAGALTRVSAAFLAAEMFVAFFTAELAHGFSAGTQLVIMLFTTMLALVLLGAGRWSIDFCYWNRKRDRL